MGVVTTAAAHLVAAVRMGRGAVAQSAPRPCATCGFVLLAVVGRALQVHQVCVRGLLVAPSLFETQEGRLTEPRGPNRLHLNCFTIAFLQQVTNLSEFGQGGPAGLGGTGARHAMTLTLQLHPLLEDLTTQR